MGANTTPMPPARSAPRYAARATDPAVRRWLLRLARGEGASGPGDAKN